MKIFLERIRRLQERLEVDSLLFLPAAPPAIRNRDTHFPYRAHSDLIYLTGVSEEQLSLIITKDSVHVFAQSSDPERERWVGRVRGHAFYLERLGNGEKTFAYAAGEWERRLAELAKGKDTLYFDFGIYADIDARVLKILNDLAASSRRGVRAPTTLKRAALLLHELRLFKDAHDLAMMREAARISSEAHMRAQERIESAYSDVGEFEIKALIEHEFMRQGADRLAYPSIVASGANATVLHYEGTAGRARQGDFILIDAGCEFQGYASDITRTTVAGGRVKATRLQQDLYDIVLAAQKSAIASTRPGKTIDEVHAAAVEVLTQGLYELGFFEQVPLRKKDEKIDSKILTRLTSSSAAREGEYYTNFYMHRTSHYLGLDVHDVGEYYANGKSRALEPGMVITVEPGLYFPVEYDFIAAEARGIGIRIEDDVLVTETGNEVLTAACPS